MAGGSRSHMSRRKLMAGVLAAPIAAETVAAGDGRRQDVVDPIVAKAERWIAGKAEIEAMIFAWQDLEHVLFDKARAMKIEVDEVMRSRMPEARAMRVISRKRNAAHLALDDLATEIRFMTPVTVAGALAKIDLGLRVQDRYAWTEHAFELAEDGMIQLRRLMAGRASPSARALG